MFNTPMPNEQKKDEVVRITCIYCRDGKIAFGRYCPTCGGMGFMDVWKSFAESNGYPILEKKC